MNAYSNSQDFSCMANLTVPSNSYAMLLLYAKQSQVEVNIMFSLDSINCYSCVAQGFYWSQHTLCSKDSGLNKYNTI